MAELAQPAAAVGHQHGTTAGQAIEEEGLVVARVERAIDVRGAHDGDRQPALAMAREEHVLAGDLVLGVLAPVEVARRVLVVGNRARVVVHAGSRHEDHVADGGRRRQQRLDVLAGGGRVGHVHHAVEALAAERRAQRTAIRAVGHEALDAARQPLGR